MSTFLLFPALAAVIRLLAGAGLSPLPTNNPVPSALVASAPAVAKANFTKPMASNTTPLQTHIQTFSTSENNPSSVTSRSWFPSVIGMSVTLCSARYYPSPDGIGSTDFIYDNAEIIGISAVPGAAPPMLHYYSTETVPGPPRDDTVLITPKGVSGDVAGVVGQVLQNSIGRH